MGRKVLMKKLYEAGKVPCVGEITDEWMGSDTNIKVKLGGEEKSFLKSDVYVYDPSAFLADTYADGVVPDEVVIRDYESTLKPNTTPKKMGITKPM